MLSRMFAKFPDTFGFTVHILLLLRLLGARFGTVLL